MKRNLLGGVLSALLGLGGAVQAETPSLPASPYVLVDQAPCCAPEPKGCGGFTAGVGFYYITPRWNNATAYDTQTVSTAPGGILQGNLATTFIDTSADFAPRLWLEYTGDSGLGIRGSWWYLDTSTTQGTTVPPTLNPAPGFATQQIVTVPGLNRANDDILGFGAPFDQGVLQVLSAVPNSGLVSTIAIESQLTMNVFDLDLHQTLQGDLWQMTLGGGARYARIDQDFSASATTPSLNGSLQVQGLQLENLFEGVGPQLFLEAERRLGRRGLSLYGNFRGGILFGDKKLSYSQTSVITNAAGVVIQNAAVNRPTQDTANLPFLELEGGVQYKGSFNWGSPFVRVGFVGQNWFNAGNPSSTVINPDGDLSLYGLQVSTGLTY